MDPTPIISNIWNWGEGGGSAWRDMIHSSPFSKNLLGFQIGPYQVLEIQPQIRYICPMLIMDIILPSWSFVTRNKET